MSVSVGAHQTAAFTVPVAGQTNSASDVLANDNALRTAYNAHDNDSTLHITSGLAAARPTYGTVGRMYYSTDSNALEYDTGSAWVVVN